MRQRVIHRVVSAVSVVGLAAVGAVVAAAPAHASVSAVLVAKVQGAYYSDAGVLGQGVVPGPNTGRAFSFKVINNGTQSSHYKLVVAPGSRLMTVTLRRGTQTLPLTSITPLIAPGASAVFTLKVVLAANAPQGAYPTSVDVVDPATDDGVATFTAEAEGTSQTGTAHNDILLKTGTQPFVTGSSSSQFRYETGSALQVGGSASFTVRLQNHGAAPTSIGLSGLPVLGCTTGYSIAVKDGLSDVTQAVYAGTYTTPVLAPGAKRDLKLTLKRTEPIACEMSFGLRSYGPDPSEDVYASVVLAY